MLSPRQLAHLGLGAAVLVMLSSVFLLHSRASEAKRLLRAQPMERAPDFVLADASGAQMSLSALRGRAVVLCFRAIGCPISNEYLGRIAEFSRHFTADQRVSIVQVNTGRGLPVDTGTSIPPGPALNVCQSIPLLMDPDGKAAAEYAVELTPTFFVIDAGGIIRYRGSFDDNRNAAQVKNHFCEDALASVLHDKPVDEPVTTPFGCALKL